MRHAVIAVVILVAGCGYSPTGPTGRMTLAISQSSLPVGGSAVVTATFAGTDRAAVSFTSSLGTFAPREAQAVDGVATTTFTATRSGTGTIAALSGSVAAEPLQVRIGESSALPDISTAPPAPTIFLSCQHGTAGAPAICSVSGSNLQAIVINWGDGSAAQSVATIVTTVAHVFERGGQYAVVARGEDRFGQVVHASATASIANPPPPPPAITQPVFTTSAFMSQDANLGVGGVCASFYVSAGAANGATISRIVVVKDGATQVAEFLGASSGRFALCGLVANTTILTATATDSAGGTATYPLIVR